MNVWHRLLGYAGLIPFLGLTGLVLTHQANAEFWLMSYAALIFSFLGGVQWFATLHVAQLPSDQFADQSAVHEDRLLFKQGVSVGVMLWAWLWLIVPQVDWFIWAGLSFWVLWLYERSLFSNIYPNTFMTLRRNLSLVAGSCLLLAGIAGR